MFSKSGLFWYVLFRILIVGNNMFSKDVEELKYFG